LKTHKKTDGLRAVYFMALLLFTVYVLLDTFVIPRTYTTAESSASDTENPAGLGQEAQDSTDGQAGTDSSADERAVVADADSYQDSHVSIQITTYREYDTNLYVADVTFTDAAYLRTAFAENSYGKNVTETTSAIAAENQAILAINGDYYGAHDRGYVLRNGTLYRERSAGDDQQDLVIDKNGTFSIISEGETTAQELLTGGAEQVLSFGPGLLENGEVTVTQNEEVDKARTSNPRTAIGQIGPLHIVLVVSDGRTSENAGLTLYQMAEFLQGLGVQTAYNLDGGGSSTLYFNGAVLNQPTSDGQHIQERSVSDIVYIGA